MKELDDVYRLRYDVYVSERGKFAEKRAASEGRIVDHFDALPGVANVVAYDGDIAVASFRVNKDSCIGLVPEKYFDFSRQRDRIGALYKGKEDAPCIVSGSMLAIRKEWRNRRNVIFALFKTTTAVMNGWGASHVFGAASSETFSLYGRLGFKAVAEEQWVEFVGDRLIPMVASFEKVFSWAFGPRASVDGPFWLDNYSAQFETVLLSPGEVLYRENDAAEQVYAIEKGGITISRQGPDQRQYSIAELGKGALFGECELFDGELRSATATAAMNTQVVVIERDQMRDMLNSDAEKMREWLQYYSHRLRMADYLAMMPQSAPQNNRVSYALEQLWGAAQKEHDSTTRVLAIGTEPVAKRVPVRESEVRRVLEMRGADGGLDYGDSIARFLGKPGREGLGFRDLRS